MDTVQWSLFLGGAIMLAYAIAGLFFLRFWTRTKDRLFAIFAVAFWVLMIERIVLVTASGSSELLPYIYMIRLSAFLLIIAAVIDKNRNPRA
ncbi:MAG: DUF5985 family protein [Verrucomicrobiota bacterium]